LISFVSADIYALKLNRLNRLASIMTVNPQNGYNRDLVDMSSYAASFPMLLNVTGFDANAEVFIVGNGLPPLLGITNTFSKITEIVPLPEYGYLLAFQPYDGVVYTIIGADPDVPYLGHLVALDLKSLKADRLAKIKLGPNQQFKLNAPLTFVSARQAWLTEFEDSNVQMIKVNSTGTIVTDLGIEGGFTSFWNDVDFSNHTVYGIKKGYMHSIDVDTITATMVAGFPCHNGTLAVSFQYKELYYFSNCGKLLLETASFDNKTTNTVNLDTSLAHLVALHSDSAYIPFLCGRPCAINTDCQSAKTCSTCRGGKCTATGECGAFCLTGDECFAGVCVGNCEYNRCGRRGCGFICNNHEDCVSVSNQCQTCRLGRCVDFGNCGAYCQTPLDCYAGDCNSKCTNYACVRV